MYDLQNFELSVMIEAENHTVPADAKAAPSV